MFIPLSSLPGNRQSECSALTEQSVLSGRQDCSFTRSACPVCWPNATKRGRPALSQEERGDRKEVGKLLKKLRREKFKTQAECAHALNLTGPSMIGALENGSWFNQAMVNQLINYLKEV